jgi:hypothetical protein
MTATVGSDVADGATIIAGNLVADAITWTVTGRVGAWVAAGMDDGGTGVKVAS